MNKWRDLVPMLVVLVLAGCATSKSTEEEAMTKTTPASSTSDYTNYKDGRDSTTVTDYSSCANPPCSSYGTGTEDKESVLSGIPSRRIIYFAYDKSGITPESRDILEKHAAYLTRHPSAVIRLEGHADERGSREYNLALAERRVEATKEILLILGALEWKITTLSYGEERPIALGHNEEAWRQNRRVELIYP